MTQYRYQTLDSLGHRHTGELEAENEQIAMLTLSRDENVVLDLSEIKERKQWKLLTTPRFVDVDTLLSFFNQFAFLVRSGLPLYQSLEMVIAQLNGKYLQEVLLDIRKNLVNGMSLSQAMRAHPNIFSDLYINMIVVGEGSGELDESFKRIVKIIENERALKKKLKKIVNYVIFMLTISLAVMVGILSFVFPKFAAIFSKVGMELPATTKFMLFASDFILAHKMTLPLIMIAIIGLTIIIFKTQVGRSLVDGLKLKLPFVKSITLEAALADFTQTLSSLLASGVPVVQALEVACGATTNSAMRPVIRRVINDVREGEKLSTAFSKHDLFPPIMIQLTAAGESSGELDAMMENINEYFKERVEDSVVRMTAIIEPFMLIVLGALVLAMALSIFLPMFNLAGAVRRH